MDLETNLILWMIFACGMCCAVSLLAWLGRALLFQNFILQDKADLTP
jgi:hypothetical protein